MKRWDGSGIVIVKSEKVRQHRTPSFHHLNSEQIIATSAPPNGGLVRKSLQNAPNNSGFGFFLGENLPRIHHPSITSHTHLQPPRTMSPLWHAFVAVRNEGNKAFDKWPRNGFGAWLVPWGGKKSRQGWQVTQLPQKLLTPKTAPEKRWHLHKGKE